MNPLASATSAKGPPAPGPFAFLYTLRESLFHHLRYNGPGITGSRDGS
jgi:hypothetical protein